MSEIPPEAGEAGRPVPSPGLPGEAPRPPEKEWAVMAVALGTPDGRIRGQVRVDTGPMRLADLVPTAHELTGVIAARANHRAGREGKTITCRAGCGACCRQMVPLSAPEAFHLMEMVQDLDPVRRAFYLGRFEAIQARLEAEKMVGPMLDLAVGSDPQRSLNRKYFAMQMACPFLVDESCSIHPDRPVACREYNVTSSALWCRDPFGNAVEKVPMPLPLSAALAWLTADLTGAPPALIPLTLVPWWVAGHREWNERKWPGLELFRRFMEIAGGPPRMEGAAAGGGSAPGAAPPGSAPQSGPPPAGPPGGTAPRQ